LFNVGDVGRRGGVDGGGNRGGGRRVGDGDAYSGGDYVCANGSISSGITLEGPDRFVRLEYSQNLLHHILELLPGPGTELFLP